MKRISQYPEVDDISILNALSSPPARSIADRETLSHYSDGLRNAYGLYARHFCDPRVIEVEELALSEAGSILYRKYDGAKKNKNLIFISTRRNTSNCVCCPFCGGVALGTLDHYLPRNAGYSHYSIFSTNLVPMCTACQGIKGAYVPTSDRERLVHPYLDSINDVTQLKILPDIDPEFPDVPSFRFIVEQLRNDPGDSLLFSILSFHVRKMKLNEREDLLQLLRRTWRQTLKEMAKIGSERERIIRGLEEVLSRARDWELPTDDVNLIEVKYDVVLLRSILQCPNTIDWICQFVEARGGQLLHPQLQARVRAGHGANLPEAA